MAKSDITKLKAEIESYQSEVSKLQQEKADLLVSSQRLTGSPSDIVEAAREESLRAARNQPIIEGLDLAIAALLQQLGQKQQALRDIEDKIKEAEADKAREQAESEWLAQGAIVNRLSVKLEEELPKLYESAKRAFRAGCYQAKDCVNSSTVSQVPVFAEVRDPYTGQVIYQQCIHPQTIDLNRVENEQERQRKAQEAEERAVHQEANRKRQTAAVEASKRTQRIREIETQIQSLNEELAGYQIQLEEFRGWGPAHKHDCDTLEHLVKIKNSEFLSLKKELSALQEKTLEVAHG